MMKIFFDRSVSIIAPYVGLDENGEYRHIDKPGFSDSFVKVPKLVVVSNAAFPEQSQFQVISHLFKRMARNIHTERKAGREIVELLKLSEETKEDQLHVASLSPPQGTLVLLHCRNIYGLQISTVVLKLN